MVLYVHERSSVMLTPRNLVLVTCSTAKPLMAVGRGSWVRVLLKSITIFFVFPNTEEEKEGSWFPSFLLFVSSLLMRPITVVCSTNLMMQLELQLGVQ